MHKNIIIAFFKDEESKKKSQAIVFNLVMLDLIKTSRRLAQLEEVNRRFPVADENDSALHRYMNKFLYRPQDVFQCSLEDLKLYAKTSFSVMRESGEVLAEQHTILHTRDGKSGTAAAQVLSQSLQAVDLETLTKRLKSSVRFSFYCRTLDSNIDRLKSDTFAPILSLKDLEDQFKLEKPRPARKKFSKFFKTLLTRTFNKTRR